MEVVIVNLIWVALIAAMILAEAPTSAWLTMIGAGVVGNLVGYALTR